jgi:hypothetical protein
MPTNPTKTRKVSPADIEGLLKSALRTSVAAANWLTDADGVTIEWAFFLADKLDRTTELADIARLGKLFETCTRDLGLSIAGRAAKPDEPIKEKSPLDAIRKAVADRKSETKTANPKRTSAKPVKRVGSTRSSSRTAAASVAKNTRAVSPKNKK